MTQRSDVVLRLAESSRCAGLQCTTIRSMSPSERCQLGKKCAYRGRGGINVYLERLPVIRVPGNQSGLFLPQTHSRLRVSSSMNTFLGWKLLGSTTRALSSFVKTPSSSWCSSLLFVSKQLCTERFYRVEDIKPNHGRVGDGQARKRKRRRWPLTIASFRQPLTIS